MMMYFVTYILFGSIIFCETAVETKKYTVVSEPKYIVINGEAILIEKKDREFFKEYYKTRVPRKNPKDPKWKVK